MKNAPFAYQSQTGEWSIFIMNVENYTFSYHKTNLYKRENKLKTIGLDTYSNIFV